MQLARAVFAALAAIMITFSPDHSAAVGMAVFSGWAIANAIIFFVSVWLVYPAGARWPSVLLGIVTAIAGMLGGIPSWRTTALFFSVVIVVGGPRRRHRDSPRASVSGAPPLDAGDPRAPR